MKKIFTLIATAMMAVSMNAGEVDIPINSGWGWGWSTEVAYTDGLMTATLTGEWGAVSTGWGEGNYQDWSKYNKLCVVFEGYTNDWGKVYFETNDGYKPEQSFSTMNSQTTVTLNFESAKAVNVKQLAIQGKGIGDVIKVSRIYLVESIAYEETGTSIAFDEWGNITSDKFASFSGNDKVVFTISVEGDISGVTGWGIGSIKSLDGSVNVGELPLKQVGDNEYPFTISELKAALEAPANQYGMQGINWNVWNQGSAVCTRKSVMVYKVKGSTPTSISNVKAAQQDGVRYNLAGQKVNEGYKGVVIMNGKKVVMK